MNISGLGVNVGLMAASTTFVCKKITPCSWFFRLFVFSFRISWTVIFCRIQLFSPLGLAVEQVPDLLKWSSGGKGGGYRYHHYKNVRTPQKCFQHLSPQQTKGRETVYFSFLIVTLITNAVSNINTSNYTQEQLSQIYDILCLYTYIEIEKKKKNYFHIF